MQGPFLLATSHRFDKLSHWITYMFFGNPFQCFVCYYYKAKVPAMKENQQIRLLSYLTINKIREKQLVLPLRSHRLDWSFYFTVLSRVWQRSMGWSGTHISLPSAGVAGPCYHTWLLQDTMSFKNILTNSYLGIQRGYWLIAGCQPIPSVSSLQTDHRVHNQSHSWLKKGSVTHSTGYTDVMLKETRGNQCAFSNQLPGVWPLLVVPVGTMLQMHKCLTTMENTPGNILMWLTKQKTACYR